MANATTTVAMPGDALRAQAAQRLQAVQESWERSDTDGFLSQWAGSLSARRDEAQAIILDNGGTSDFPALFQDGVLVAAKLIQTRFGLKWGVLASDDPKSAVTQWLAPGTRAAKKHGFTLGTVQAPAKAILDSSGHGLSGNTWVAVIRTDGGFSRNVTVVSVDDRMD